MDIRKLNVQEVTQDIDHYNLMLTVIDNPNSAEQTQIDQLEKSVYNLFYDVRNVHYFHDGNTDTNHRSDVIVATDGNVYAWYNMKFDFIEYITINS